MTRGRGRFPPAAPSVSRARATETGFLNRVLREGGGISRYQVYVPAVFDPNRRWPVILFLHGSGERGEDGLLQTSVGLGDEIRRHSERFPVLVVFPQAPEGARWSGETARLALGELDRTIREFGGDPDRTYAVGLSMGGYGVLRIAGEHPERFAAVVSVCGGVVPPPGIAGRRRVIPNAAPNPYDAAAGRLKRLPVRLYHGAGDPVVPPEESRRLAEALEKRGGDVRHVEYPGVGHDSWTPAFEDPELWRWLLAQRRAPKKNEPHRGR